MALTDWRPAWNADFGFATAPTMPPVSQWIRQDSNGNFTLNGKRWMCCGVQTLQTTAALSTPTLRDGISKRSAAKGGTAVRIVGIDTRQTPAGLWADQGGDIDDPTDSGWRQVSTAYALNALKNNKTAGISRVYRATTGGTTGVGTGPSGTDSGIADGTVVWAYERNTFSLMDATYLTYLDEAIANWNSRGIYVWFTPLAHYGQARMGAGLPSNVRGDDDAYWDNGMMWSSTWMTIAKAYLTTICTRVNTVTNVRYIDNPGIFVWEAFNENGIADSFKTAHYDDILNDYDSGAYWAPELQAKFADWWATSPSSPGGLMPAWSVGGTRGFPLYATWSGWGTPAEKQAMVNCINDWEYDAAVEMKAFFRALNPNILYSYTTSSYIGQKANEVSDVATFHAYAKVNPVTTSLPYNTRESILDNNNAWEWTKSATLRRPGQALVLNEFGAYGLTLFDPELEPLGAVFLSLQGADGWFTFFEGQNQVASSIVGIQGAALTLIAGWPSRKLGGLLGHLILRGMHVAPHSTTKTYTVDPANIASLTVLNHAVYMWFQSGWTINNGGSNQWAHLTSKLYTEIGTPQSTAPITSITNVTVTAGQTVTVSNGTLYMRGRDAVLPTARLNFKGVQGWITNVEDGAPTASGSASNGSTLVIAGSGGFTGTCCIVSMGEYPLYSGDMLMFIHQHSYPTDVHETTTPGTWDGSTQTVNIDTAGTEALTRIKIPASFSVTLTSGRDMTVHGVTATGTLVDMTPTWDSGAGTIQFNTSASYPLYLVKPKTGTGARSLGRTARTRS